MDAVYDRNIGWGVVKFVEMMKFQRENLDFSPKYLGGGVRE